ncbi:MAG TPA: CrcB family protein [Nocardioidaceae bacterium]|nr:CrcB family protein [Nocardioidaceae bacterium]
MTSAPVSWVAAGGAAGATLRYALGEWFPEAAGAFPWTTLAINVAGSFLLAVLLSRSPRPEVQALLGPGLLGGFTTLSAYSEQTRQLLDSGDAGLAVLYVAGTLAACLVAVALARRVR